MDNWVQKWIYRPFSKSRSLAWPDTSSRILQEHFHSTNLILKKKNVECRKDKLLTKPTDWEGQKVLEDRTSRNLAKYSQGENVIQSTRFRSLLLAELPSQMQVVELLV